MTTPSNKLKLTIGGTARSQPPLGLGPRCCAEAGAGGRWAV